MPVITTQVCFLNSLRTLLVNYQQSEIKNNSQIGGVSEFGLPLHNDHSQLGIKFALCRINMKKPQRTTLEEIIETRSTRRDVVKGALAAGGAMTAMWCLPNVTSAGEAVESSGETKPETTELDSIPEFPHVHVTDDPRSVTTDEVAEGYQTQVLVKWGDPIIAGASPIDLKDPSPEDQEKQFGYNNDFVAYLPLERGSTNSKHGLLCVNNEYTNPELMFPGITVEDKLTTRTDRNIRVEAAAHGLSVMEIRQDSAAIWHVIQDSRFNRRISMNTKVHVSGPAAGDVRLQTAHDPTGSEVLGTVNNCAGGVTPWGTVLSGEENFQYYFRGRLSDPREACNHKRYGVDGNGDYAFCRLDDRFDLCKTPREPNRFGWVVEIDPYDPNRPAVKRTALGRCRHEGAATAVNYDGRVVVYTGDDEAFEYVYKFVTEGKYDPTNLENNRDLLDHGTLFVARFDADGSVSWLPLAYGYGPLTPQNGFHSQADVLIETRRAADCLCATPMDRPEDIEENPVTNNVFVVLTNNTLRTNQQLDAANPRCNNQHGHIIELKIPQRDGKPDHAATNHKWEIFLRAGQLAEDCGWYQGHKPNTWLSCPDNIAFDNQGRLWIATDGFQETSGILDGIYVCEVEGPRRALTKQFFHVPTGAELCGPCFTPDNSTLFVAVQHPGELSTYDEPSTRWPNSPNSDLPPQPAVVAITRKSGGTILG